MSKTYSLYELDDDIPVFNNLAVLKNLSEGEGKLKYRNQPVNESTEQKIEIVNRKSDIINPTYDKIFITRQDENNKPGVYLYDNNLRQLIKIN